MVLKRHVLSVGRWYGETCLERGGFFLLFLSSILFSFRCITLLASSYMDFFLMFIDTNTSLSPQGPLPLYTTSITLAKWKTVTTSNGTYLPSRVFADMTTPPLSKAPPSSCLGLYTRSALRRYLSHDHAGAWTLPGSI